MTKKTHSPAGHAAGDGGDDPLVSRRAGRTTSARERRGGRAIGFRGFTCPRLQPPAPPGDPNLLRAVVKSELGYLLVIFDGSFFFH